MSLSPPQLYSVAPEKPGPEVSTTVVADSVALRKDFSKTPSYWVELLYNSRTQLWSVRKRWSWSRKGQLMEGESPHSPTGDVQDVVNKYAKFVTDQVELKQYLIVERQCPPWSP